MTLGGDMKESDIIDQVCSLVKAGKRIVPFSESQVAQLLPDDKAEIAFVDLSNYQAIEEYNPLDQTISVQCGIKISALNSFLTENKQWLPVSDAHRDTSLLDLILTGDAGPLQVCFGGLRRHILGLTFVLGNGNIAHSGGRVVKNVSGYDLTRFLIGSYGYFAIPIKAHLRLYALPELSLTVITTSNNLGRLFTVSQNIIANGISLAFMDLVEQSLLTRFFLKDSSVKKGSDQDKYVLVARIFGRQEAVESQVQTIKEILAQNNLPVDLRSGADDQEELLKQLATIDTGGDFAANGNAHKSQMVDLALKSSDCLRLLQNRDFASLPFLYRTGSGRLRFYLSSSAQQDLLLANLSVYAKEYKLSLNVAYGDSVYMRRMSSLNSDTNGGEVQINLIKKRLKEQFDPDNLFNPFVDL